MYEEMTGKTYGSLTVIDIAKNTHNHTMCDCRCICGRRVLVKPCLLYGGKRKSCGCKRERKIKHQAGSYIGQTFGRWTVLDVDTSHDTCCAICKCICGQTKRVNIYNLIAGRSKDCGCGRKQYLSVSHTKDIVGYRFGRLVVQSRLGSDSQKRATYKCLCDCGNETIASSSSLISGHTQSCGCLISRWNQRISNVLSEMSIRYISEYSVEIEGRQLRFDFYIPTLNCMIEYDGEQHYFPVNFGGWSDAELLSRFKLCQKRDKLKTQYCLDKNIYLLRIPYWDKENIGNIISNCLQRLSEKDII